MQKQNKQNRHFKSKQQTEKQDKFFNANVIYLEKNFNK